MIPEKRQTLYSREQDLRTAGIDIGSLSAEALILDATEGVLGFSILPTGASSEAAGENAYSEALHRAGMSREDISSVVATGYGRISVPFATRTVTEITCHALGARWLFPTAATVIDIGGQDSKVVRLSADGRVEDFTMNDKCAAGTGRFLEVMARALESDVEMLGELSSGSKQDVKISSTCTVFAESEVVGLIARGVPREDIIRGLHTSIAERIHGMVRRIGGRGPFVMTGGVAKNTGVLHAIEERLGETVLVPAEPQIVGALGAAIAALELSASPIG
jgi:(R)-2-hydroxyacyl-CoA dehydratese activating ATPase